jgi:hypothetical protein
MTYLDDVFGDGNPHKDTEPDCHGLTVSDSIPASMTNQETGVVLATIVMSGFFIEKQGKQYVLTCSTMPIQHFKNLNDVIVCINNHSRDLIIDGFG